MLFVSRWETPCAKHAKVRTSSDWWRTRVRLIGRFVFTFSELSNSDLNIRLCRSRLLQLLGEKCKGKSWTILYRYYWAFVASLLTGQSEDERIYEWDIDKNNHKQWMHHSYRAQHNSFPSARLPRHLSTKEKKAKRKNLHYSSHEEVKWNLPMEHLGTSSWTHTDPATERTGAADCCRWLCSESASCSMPFRVKC